MRTPSTFCCCRSIFKPDFTRRPCTTPRYGDGPLSIPIYQRCLQVVCRFAHASHVRIDRYTRVHSQGPVVMAPIHCTTPAGEHSHHLFYHGCDRCIAFQGGRDRSLGSAHVTTLATGYGRSTTTTRVSKTGQVSTVGRLYLSIQPP
jgi:hypothetical protein